VTGEEITRQVQDIVAGVAGVHRTPADAGPDTPLGEDGFWLDSVDFLEVIVACEQAFGTEFGAEADVTPDNLRTVRTLAETIQAKLRAG